MNLRRFVLALCFVAASAGAQGTPDERAARGIAASCAACHGTDGASAGGVPSLAGQSKADLVRKMQDFKAGRTPSTIMGQLAKGYSDEQIELAAGHFAARKP
ncbi:MAG TPA: c-type cytochrome [Casimicrobiaceae bacterium]|nr:c-type cytochrome [Casimicrobiaceae bacterium]